MLPDHGPPGGQAHGGADHVPHHAVHGHLLPPGGRLPARRGPAQGQHARARLLRPLRPEDQARGALPPHALRPQGGAGQDVQVGPRQRHLHGGHGRGRRQEDHERLLPHQARGQRAEGRGRRDAPGEGRLDEPLPGLREAHPLLQARVHLSRRRQAVRQLRRGQEGLRRRRDLRAAAEEGPDRRGEHPAGAGPAALPVGRRRQGDVGQDHPVEEGEPRALRLPHDAQGRGAGLRPRLRRLRAVARPGCAARRRPGRAPAPARRARGRAGGPVAGGLEREGPRPPRRLRGLRRGLLRVAAGEPAGAGAGVDAARPRLLAGGDDPLGALGVLDQRHQRGAALVPGPDPLQPPRRREPGVRLAGLRGADAHRRRHVPLAREVRDALLRRGPRERSRAGGRVLQAGGRGRAGGSERRDAEPPAGCCGGGGGGGRQPLRHGQGGGGEQEGQEGLLRASERRLLPADRHRGGAHRLAGRLRCRQEAGQRRRQGLRRGCGPARGLRLGRLAPRGP
mmetsp:Transcript_55284/g.171283  ORF Transcript_55284/g.171283 Transcript_55284/m.171283 type:complete len:508 (-) Transcript_55284:177-1700(-)